MPPPSSEPRPSRPSLADVARLAGVALMTASYAMRNNPKISAATRKKVQRAARKLGYVPHPEIGRLMHLLRSRQMPSFQATIAFLSVGSATEHGQPAHPYTVGVVNGAKKRAESLGYTVDEFSIVQGAVTTARLSTMLRSRGIRGVLIPPLASVEDCSKLLDWPQFAVVAANYSALNLIVNRVVPHHQNNMLTALSRLKELGYTRVGLVLTTDFVQRANWAYEATMALFQQRGELAIIPPLTISPDGPTEPRSALEWTERFKPEVFVTIQNAVSLLEQATRSVPRRIPICLLDHPGQSKLAGIYQQPSIVGEMAIDLLAGQLQRGEYGLHTHPRTSMIEGTWIWGDLPPLVGSRRRAAKAR